MAVSLIVDGDHQMHRSLHLPNLRKLKTKKSNKPTGIVFGVINILNNVIKRLPERVDQVYFLMGGRRNWRYDIDPNYKYKDPEDKEKWKAVPKGEEFSYHEIYNFSRKVLEDYLPCMGVRVLAVDGHEADDIGYLLAKKLKQRNKDSIAVSGDNDWLQMVNDPGIDVYQPMKEQRVSSSNFEEIVGIPKESIVLQLSIEGGHDNIPKVQDGLGSKGISNMILKLPEGSYSPSDVRAWAKTQTAQKFKGLDDDAKMKQLYTNLKLVDFRRIPFTRKTHETVEEFMRKKFSFDREQFELFVKEFELQKFAGLKGQPTFRALR